MTLGGSSELVSIIIAGCPIDANVSRTLESILTGTVHEDFEIVIVDAIDSVRDRIPALTRSHLETERIRYLTPKKPLGPLSAVGFGVNEAHGDLLVFTPPLTAVPEGWLSQLIAHLYRLGGTAAVWPATSRLDQIEWKPGPRSSRLLTIGPTLDWSKERHSDMAEQVPLSDGTCLLVSRTAIRRANGLTLQFASTDMAVLDLLIRLFSNGGALERADEIVVGSHEFHQCRPGDARSRLLDRLRIAHLHLGPDARHRLTTSISSHPHFDEARADLKRWLASIEADAGTAHLHTEGRGVSFEEVYLPALAKNERPKSTPYDTDSRVSVAFMGHCIEVHSVVPKLMTKIRLTFDHMLVDGSTPDATIQVVSGPSGHSVLVNGRQYSEVRSDGGLHRAVANQIVRRFSEHFDRYIWLHASAASMNDLAVVMIGTYGAGKSTLIEELCTNGWTYVSDDILPIDPQSGSAVPFPTSPFVRRPRSSDSGASNFSIEYLRFPRNRVQSKPVPIRAFVFPRVRPQGTTSLTSITPSRAGLELLHHCMNFGARTTTLREVAGLLSSTCVRMLTFSRPEEAREHLASLLMLPN